MVIACWCQREAGVNGAPPLSAKEQEDLNFLYEEWAHPFFISYQEFCRLMQVGDDDCYFVMAAVMLLWWLSLCYDNFYCQDDCISLPKIRSGAPLLHQPPGVLQAHAVQVCAGGGS
jgi:hypothetical protein